MRMRFAFWLSLVCGLLLLLSFPALARVPDPETERDLGALPTTQEGADLWISKYSGTLDTMPGRTVKYYIPFGNRGPRVATGVVISDTLPSVNGFYVYTWEWDNAYALGLTRQHSTGEQRRLQWGGELQPGTSKMLEVVLRVASNISSCLTLPDVVGIRSSITDPNPEDNQATVYGPPIRVPDLSVSKAVDGIAVPGDTITYTLVYSNTGCVAAQDVVITDVLPSLVTFVSASIPPDSVTDGTVVWHDTVLEAGSLQAVSISLVARVKDGALTGNVLTNTVTVSTVLPENSPKNNTATITTTVKRADVTLTKSCPPPAIPGAQVDYALGYANVGLATAKAVRITDELPQGVTFITSTWQIGAGEVFQPLAPEWNGQELTWSLGDVSTGVSGTLTVTVALADWLRSGDVLTNAATIETATPEDRQDNNAAACGSLIQRADLWLYTTCPTATIPGRPITYVVEFGNRGTATATGIVLTDCFPLPLVAGFDVLNCTVPYTPVITSGDCYSWELADLAPGVSGRIVFTATVAGTAGAGQVEAPANNSVTIATLTPELSYLNNSLECSTPIRRSDIRLDKWVTPNSTLTPGQAVTFTLAYYNAGTTPAETVIVTDVLPIELTYVAARTRPAPTRIDTGPTVCTYTWEIGQVAAGARGYITLGVGVSTVVSWHATIRVLTNVAYVTSSTPESDLENQYASVDARVAPGCPAKLTVIAVPDRLPADGRSEATLTITATDVYSNQVLNGTVIQLRTDHGQFKAAGSLPGGLSIQRPTQDGVVSAQLIADPKASVARIEILVLQPGEGCNRDLMGEVKATRTISFEAAALQISKAVQPATPIVPGDTVTYTVTYLNKGPGVAMGTRITDTLPSGFVIVDWPIPTSPTITPTVQSGQTLAWSAGDLPAGASGIITITGYFGTTPSPDWRPSQAMSNCVAIASLTDDPTTSDNVACAGNDLRTCDVWVDLQAMQSEALPGGTITWRIRVGNKGPAIARDVRLTDTLPPGTAFFRSSITNTNPIPGTNDVVLNVGDLAPTQALTLTLLARVSEDDVTPAQLLTNSVRVSTPTYEWDLGNNRDTDAGVTVHAPDLAVSLAPAYGPICEGNMMTYVVSYANLGNAPAEGVVVTVTFDPELICPDGVECSQTMSFELGTVDRGGSGQIPVRWRLPQVGACHPGLSGGLGKVLASTACISTSSVEPARVRSNNCFTDRLPVLCCQFFVEVHYARENYY